MPANYDKLKGLLRELFQMDQADLDFGIYRIMNAKREEIERFLEHDLLPQVQEELARHVRTDGGVKQSELDEAIKAAKSIGVDPDSVSRVRELREQVKQGTDLAALENEVFSHLYNFFRRYYDQGDFLSLRRYKEGVYAIPYEGEEVKLYWANHDQYYIKSSEYLRNYAFKLADGRRVHFKVAEADAEADNNKPEAGKERRFILAESEPVIATEAELTLRFEYRAVDRKQAELNAEAVAAVLGDSKLGAWRMALAEARSTEKDKQRTLLEKHLSDFTAKNTFDYFIHKNLGSFLRRELDFFIKNEIMHLDDVEDEAVPKVELYLSKIKALRRIAHKVIAFLDQLESFQKKLWLKKKFVVETNYCVTLDRVPEELYAEIIKNKAQIEEWKQLFDIKNIVQSLENPGYSEPLKMGFFEANQFLVLDTKHFGDDFLLKLISSSKLLGEAETLSEAVEGVLFHADNFHALNLAHRRYRRELKCVYIDPPYNTGWDAFPYKDNYQHSSWLALIADRLALALPQLATNGVLLSSIDDIEVHRLKLLCETRFAGLNFISQLVWKSRQHLDSRAISRVSNDHEYVVAFGRTADATLRGADKDLTKYSNPDNDFRGPWMSRSMLGLATASQRPNLHYDIIDPATGNSYPCPSHTGWRYSPATMNQKIAEGRILFPKDANGRPREKVFERELKDEFTGFSSVITDIFTAQGSAEIRDMFGYSAMQFPKPSALMTLLLEQTLPPSECVLDFFAGSGTTAHAVINLNRKDRGNRKYVLAELGDYFETVLKPRIKKVTYSDKWSEGKPTSRQGSSHVFKYTRLESYDDCLNNLELKRTKTQDDLLTQAPAFREDYTLRYMLDVETQGSASLLNVQKFTDPFSYKLKVSTGTVGETKEVNVDLVETFNWLIGLKVKHIDHIRNVRVVEGANPQGDRLLILWRNVAEVPNDKLDEWFSTQGYNTRDQEYDIIYVNGDNNLENLRREDQTWKVRLIEEDFHKLMWECQDV